MKKSLILVIGLAIIFSAVSSFASATNDIVKYNLRISNRSEVNALFPQYPYYATVQITDKGDCIEFFVDQIQESYLTPCETGGGHVLINQFVFNSTVDGLTVNVPPPANWTVIDQSTHPKQAKATDGYGTFEYIVDNTDGISSEVQTLTFTVCKAGTDLQIENFEELSWLKQGQTAENGLHFFAVQLTNFCLNLYESDGITPINSAHFTYCPDCTGIPPTVIELSSFTARASNGNVKLRWVTEAEIDNAGFNIWRSEVEDGDYVQLNDEAIPAKGSETNGAKYVFTDNVAKNRKTYFYKLQDIDVSGVSTFHGPVSEKPRPIYAIFPFLADRAK
jgi:hypothetical protein